MDKTMTPSAESKVMTARQIDKAVANYRALLEKHSSEFSSEAVQLALGQPGLATDMFTLFRKRVEVVSDMIVRIVIVNRNRTSKEAIDATRRVQYTDRDVVDSMPCGEGEKTEVFFFKVGRYVSDDDLEKEYALRGLIPDPRAIVAVNEADPAFADDHPNGTHWKNPDGKWCFATFVRWSGDERCVFVGRGGNRWGDDWWFGGVRKYQK